MAIPKGHMDHHTHMTRELASWKGRFPDLWHRTMQQARNPEMHHRIMREAIMVMERDMKRVARVSPTHTRQMAELKAFQKAMDAPLPSPKQWFRMSTGELDEADTKSRVIFKVEADRNALLLLLPPTP